ncbi:GNAT family N-acetyltransferase [Actinokineospora cianjurensis]|uniref:N-acetylglutamate synthase-like GNAT family acetyltransferase n=1 Tax=Actinokineospora cianjurensis TaxID=585224 RepID=A0A421AZG3_9PSEU|nr:GNAT family N-acetyltransferase [Actinokineospora cianjurensis]RLK55189.1 N-acetylglutamate synthase-like GNAT family acetyltransferase [Actinokineospora cianjurensis]
MIVRKATDADMVSVALLRRRAGEEDGPVPDPGFEAEFARWWERERSYREFWLAEIDDKPVGFCCLVEVTRMPKPGIRGGAWGYLSNFFVLPEHRNAGVGAALIAALLRHAEDLGYPRVVLTPSERAIPFYERAGLSPADSLMLRVFATE